MTTIILIILIVIIFKALFGNFGFISDEELKAKEEAIKKFLEQQNLNNNDSMNDCNLKNKNEEIEVKEIKNLINFKGNNSNIDLEKEKQMIEEQFFKTIEKVVETVIVGLAENKIDVLKNLLTKEMFSIFESEINSNINNHKILKSVIVSFEDKQILKNEKNVIEIKLSMKQINYIENENHEIIMGDKDKIININEIWEFVINRNSENNVPWLISSIREAN